MFAKLKEIRTLLLFLSAFTLFAGISIFVSESSVSNGFFGVYGRNTGFLTYLSLAILFLGAALLQTSSSIKVVLGGLFYAGIVNVVYFLLTRIGLEPLGWNNSYHRILGTFGNPNFVGAFMGIFIILCTARLVDTSTSLIFKGLLIGLILISLYEVKLSLAVQGIVITALGWGLVLFFILRSRFNSRLLLFLYSAFVGVVGLLAAGGALQKGPLVKYIYKTSVTLRGEYWYAGWHMGITHPIFGVGMDSYGIWYRRMRAPSALILPGPETTSDAAHNVFMDIFSYGGFPLFITYIALNALVLLHIWRGIKVFKQFDLAFVSITATWICYTAQSIISINQIGLAIWGWILGGLIIGYVRAHTKGDEELIEIKAATPPQKGRIATKKQKPISILLMVLGVIVGGAIASPPTISDSKWADTLRKLDPTQIEKNSKVWPLESLRLMQASTIYTSHKVPTKGLQIARFTVEKFPNNFYAWRVLSDTPGVTEVEKAKAKSEMHRLDPLNPAFK